MFPCEDSKTVSVCLSVHREKNYLSFVNISPTLVIDTSMERSSLVLQHGNPKSWIFSSKKFEIEFCPYPEKRNLPGFVNISPTLVIDTSMKRSSRVLQHGNPIFFSIKFEIEFWLVPKRWNHSSRSQHEPIWRHRGMHRRPFEGRHLVFNPFGTAIWNNLIFSEIYLIITYLESHVVS